MSKDDLKDAVLSYRVPAALKADLQKLADADRRKLGAYVQIILEEHVTAKKAAKKGKQP